MSLLSNLLGGGNQSATSTTEPWKQLQPYLTGAGGLFPEAQQLFQQGPSQFFPGQTYAGFDPLQSQSQQMGTDYAASGLGGILPSTMGSFQNAVSGGLMSPDSNPYLAQNIQNMAQQVQENIALSGIPQNATNAQASGQYGSSRHGLADYLTRKNANEVIARNTNDMLMGGYNSGLNAMMQGIGMAPQMANLGMAPSNLLNQIGGERQGMAQRGIDESMQRYQYGQEAPWQNLGRYQGILGGNYMGSGGVSTAPLSGGSPLGGALGGALTGFAATGGPWGAALGGLGGLLSSR